MNKNSTRNLYILLGLVLLIGVAGAFYFTKLSEAPVVLQNPTAKDLAEYKNESLGFALQYPKEFVVEEDMLGTAKFHFPQSYTAGTNLSEESSIAISVAQDNKCEPSTFLEDGENPGMLPSKNLNGVEWSGLETKGAGAGNFYDTTVYTAQRNGRCYGAVLFIHSTNIGNYTPGTVKAYNEQQVREAYDIMTNSFVFLSK